MEASRQMNDRVGGFAGDPDRRVAAAGQTVAELFRSHGGMKGDFSIRVAGAGDVPRIRHIYAPFCAPDCPVSFECEPPSLAVMEERVSSTLDTMPFLVMEEGGEVCGYAYAGPHRARAAYRWSCEVSIYMAGSARGRGAGKRLYSCLLDILRLQGYCNAFGGVTLPNPGSVALHLSLGFESVGVYRRVGFKNGAWHDVAWFGTRLLEVDGQPSDPVPFPALAGGGG